jgi:hypothetical protein
MERVDSPEASEPACAFGASPRRDAPDFPADGMAYSTLESYFPE